MMPKKKRITILIISIILVVFIITAILSGLYLKTDMFKSNQTLFMKYFSQNFNIVEILKYEKNIEVENLLETSKYTSQLEGKIQYTENIGTSDENTNSPINDVKLNIKSDIDKIENYDYRNISIETQEDKLVGIEYLKQNNNEGIRLNGINEFVSIEENEVLDKINNLNIDINSILNFTEEEKETLINTYTAIIESNISKDKYYNQKNAIITVNNKDCQVNKYYIKISLEQLNNLYVKILEQIVQDEIILSRLDLIENQIKENYSDYETEESLREQFLNNINEKIQDINDSNIGSEEIQIAVYESDGQIVRNEIEKSTDKITIDLYNNYSGIKIDRVILGEYTNEEFLKIERTNNEIQFDVLLEYEKIQDNEIVNNISFNVGQSFENSQLITEIELGISNEKYDGIVIVKDETIFLEEFENQIMLDGNIINLNDLSEEQKELVNNILNQNMQLQLSNLSSKIELNDYIEMFRNLNIIKQSSIQLPDESEVTEIEKTRFNSQFEFFVSEDLTTDNLKQLMNVVKDNLEDIKVLLKNGDIEEVDLNKLDSNNEEYADYKENISEILIVIKENSNNEEKRDGVLDFLENNKNNKYDVSIQYDDNGFAQVIRVKVKDE